MRIALAAGLILLAALPAQPALGHSLFNSAEEFIGGYRVQIATLPEFPQIGEDSQLLLRVTDADFEEVQRMTVGMRIFYNGEQIRGVQPTSVQGAHLETGFVFEEPGNHIVKVDLYDAGESGVIKALRSFLHREKALPRPDTYIFGYWKIGLIEDQHQKIKRLEAES